MGNYDPFEWGGGPPSGAALRSAVIAVAVAIALAVGIGSGSGSEASASRSSEMAACKPLHSRTQVWLSGVENGWSLRLKPLTRRATAGLNQTPGVACPEIPVMRPCRRAALSFPLAFSLCTALLAPSSAAAADLGRADILLSTSSILQIGEANIARSSQVGEGHRAMVQQTGNGHFAEIRQAGQGNSIDLAQSGLANTLLALQSGNHNQMVVNQLGGASASLSQTGSNNRISLSQAAGQHMAYISQSGNGNTASISQR